MSNDKIKIDISGGTVNLDNIVQGDSNVINPRSKGSSKSTEKPDVVILVLTAEPSDETKLQIGKEIRQIRTTLRGSIFRDQFKLEQRHAVEPADISEAVLEEKPNIVHFSGHGIDSGELCFQNEVGQLQPVEPEALSDLFGAIATKIDCVLLNACFSAVQANAIARKISHVIGMQNAIDDNAAIAFTTGFYQALGAGESIKDAYAFGCIQAKLQGLSGYLTPVLFLNGEKQGK